MGAAKKKLTLSEKTYKSFDVLDGSHPWKEKVPEGFIEYPVRIIRQAKVTYFNFALAKEMGLLPWSHPEKMNSFLEKKIIETFSLRIINEYDQEKGRKFAPSDVKPNKYMATRYLQLQHANKKGGTSGDGRGIWNGCFKGRGGVFWDVSSRGTGVTVLSPGAVQAGKPLETGNTDYGYGCGLAELDELYSAAVLSEVLHHKGILTERVLAIIDHGNGFGVGVRAGKNLFRPAHLFLYLKQGKYEPLKRAVDFLIDRLKNKGAWNGKRQKYKALLSFVSLSFAKFSALLEREYIFSWMDWDGDNVLFEGGIIDYGSVRQFGLRHDQYRYDDVERFSTNLNEQKNKAKKMVQAFVQMVDFLETREKRPFSDYVSHPELEKFEEAFQREKLFIFLKQLGFSDVQRRFLMRFHKQKVQDFYKVFEYFEKKKTFRKLQKVEDGVNRPAIFNMRRFFKRYLERRVQNQAFDNDRELFCLLLADSASGKDRDFRPELVQKLRQMLSQYEELMGLAFSAARLKSSHLKDVYKRVCSFWAEPRITGNGLILVVQDMLDSIQKGKLSKRQVQPLIEGLIHSYAFSSSKEVHRPLKKHLSAFQQIIQEYSESI
ncbi:MAG: hypothetical protein D6797_08340 [Bdellovibrio sp.]|nr:MAG: hypothetical protein D6797_08340 [Bdellovibrio sp.]